MTEQVEIGRVARAHGLRGEVSVKLYFAESELLGSLDSVRLGSADDCRELTIEAARPTPKGWLLKLRGVDDRNAAEALSGAPLWVPRSALPEPGENEYYLSDLVGARVVGPEGEIGEVIEVRIHPSVDTAVIRAPDGRTLEQPLVDAWVEEVDLDAGVVRLSSTDGLVD